MSVLDMVDVPYIHFQCTCWASHICTCICISVHISCVDLFPVSMLNMSDAHLLIILICTCLICWLSDICLFIIAHFHCVELLPVSIPNMSDTPFVHYVCMCLIYCHL